MIRGARNPVGLLAVDQVADDVERAERVRAFGGAAPAVAQTTEQHVERARGALQDVDGLGQIELHGILSLGGRGQRALRLHEARSFSSASRRL